LSELPPRLRNLEAGTASTAQLSTSAPTANPEKHPLLLPGHEAAAYAAQRSGKATLRRATIMKTFNLNAIIQGLVLIRMGQELGTDSRLAKAVHDLVEVVMVICR